MTIVDAGRGVKRFAGTPPTAADVVALKGRRTIAACIPARDEAGTIDQVVATCARLADVGVLDEVVVVDDHSVDATAERCRRAGIAVVTNPAGPGKGQALRCATSLTTAEILVFLDADVVNFSERFVTGLVRPLLDDPGLQLVKAAYRRSLDGRPDEGGRVTELLARPLLARFFPDLAGVSQPLAGECAVRRQAVADVFADRYGIEMALLIDVFQRFGCAAIAEVDLGDRVHRNRPLLELRAHADDVLDAVLSRACV
ncbi:MAG: glycosyltransferase [Actinobacteria bacterium]|nr:glycosyltransferase [Actinomycetota bacterium]